jgi:hypothetical protein
MLIWMKEVVFVDFMKKKFGCIFLASYLFKDFISPLFHLRFIIIGAKQGHIYVRIFDDFHF